MKTVIFEHKFELGLIIWTEAHISIRDYPNLSQTILMPFNTVPFT